MMKRASLALRYLGILVLLGLFPGDAGLAQGDSHTFPQTGHTVRGSFWQYWQSHGGLTQQGYPISEEMQETSPLNGQSYTVQYFERAVFELHPENQPPFDVLLSQLGTFLYKSKYPNGAPDQRASTSNAHYFAETGYNLGGVFRDYWNQHGGLIQQGYPISDEFTEVSELNGQPYTVQYFERAVFELHPENQPPYNVLLSQLGTFRYRSNYQGGGGPTPVPATEVSGGGPSSPTSTPDPHTCSGLPPNQGVVVDPPCGQPGVSFTLSGTGFTPGEVAIVRFYHPDGTQDGYNFEKIADGSGNICCPKRYTTAYIDLGLWKVVMDGQYHQQIGYFKIIP